MGSTAPENERSIARGMTRREFRRHRSFWKARGLALASADQVARAEFLARTPPVLGLRFEPPGIPTGPTGMDREVGPPSFMGYRPDP